MYTKCLDKTSRVCSLHHNKENVSHTYSPEVSGLLSLIERLRSTVNSWIMQYFTHNWHNTFTIHVPSLIGVEFLWFIKSQFTKKCSECSPPEPMYAWAPFQRSRGSCKWSDRHKIRVGKVFLHFQFKLNTLGVLNVPTDKNLKNWGVWTWRLNLEIIQWYELVLVQGTHP